MNSFLISLGLSSALISTVLWVARTNPVLGGFILSLPLTTMVALALSRITGAEPGNTFELAKSTFLAVPLSLVFFVPFLFGHKLSFWTAYGLGTALLFVAYIVHQTIWRTYS